MATPHFVKETIAIHREEVGGKKKRKKSESHNVKLSLASKPQPLRFLSPLEEKQLKILVNITKCISCIYYSAHFTLNQGTSKFSVLPKGVRNSGNN